MDAADGFGAAVHAREHELQVEGHVAEVGAQRRRLGVPTREDHPAEGVDVRHLAQAVLAAVEAVAVHRADARHGDSVLAATPTEIGR